MDQLDRLMNETAKNVSAATQHANGISSHSNQLKLQLGKTQELYSRETSVAVKQTAENLLNLITTNANAKENVDKEAGQTPVPFLEFKPKAEERIASIGGTLMTVGCIIENE